MLTSLRVSAVISQNLHHIFFDDPFECLTRKLFILDHPGIEGSKDDQFASFKGGVNELIDQFY